MLSAFEDFMQQNKRFKNFAVIALGWMGDTLMAEGLCKNIKSRVPDAKITFVVLKAFADIPKLISSVDDIVVYDKKVEHKGLLGYFKFAKLFKDKNIDVAIIVHPHERSVLCAISTGAKNIVSLPLKGKLNPLNLFINIKKKVDSEEILNVYKNDYNANYLNLIGFETVHTEVDLVVPLMEQLSGFELPEKYVVLVPESKNEFRSWDYENIALFIKQSKFPVVLTGTAQTLKLAERLENDEVEFINLAGKTTIMELAFIIQKALATVSVDTGAMHLSYGLGVETICLFYVADKVKKWLPQDRKNVHLLLGERVTQDGKIVTLKPITYSVVLNELSKL